MIAVKDLFEGKMKSGFKEAGKSALAGAGLGLKSVGQAATGTGETLHDKFTKKNQTNLDKTKDQTSQSK